MIDQPWTITEGTGPLVATAIHHGHALREEVGHLVVLPAGDRLREEDPYTGDWTQVAPTRIVAHRSRFEVDLNRPRDRCVYSEPSEAWGLDLWRGTLPPPVRARSVALWDRFYAALADLYDRRLAQVERLLILDLHSYNYRRDGPAATPDPAAENPEINLGTGTMDRAFWAPVVDEFIASLQGAHRPPLDVRENVRFRGGNMARWLHDRYPRRVCVLSVEARKSFMDEWTGRLDAARFKELKEAFEAAAAAAVAALGIPS